MVSGAAVLAVITGTSRGIGAGIAAAAEAAGATVAVCNRRPTGRSPELEVDLADPAAWPRFAHWYRGLIDELAPERVVVFHNAATLDPIGFAGSVDPQAYTTNVLLNSASPQVLGAAVVRTAVETSTPTTLVQLSSGAATTAWAGWSSYCAAKAAVEHWVRVVGRETGADDLMRVLAIAPGVVSTNMQATIRATEVDDFPDGDRFRTMHAADQLGDPDEVGATLWTYANSDRWETGATADVRNL